MAPGTGKIQSLESEPAEATLQPLSDEELELLYTLHRLRITDEEKAAFQVLERARKEELEKLRPPKLTDMIMRRISDNASVRSEGEGETQRARTFYTEQVRRSDDEIKKRALRYAELQGAVYNTRDLDAVREDFVHEFELFSSAEGRVLQERAHARALTHAEDQRYIQLIQKLESGTITQQEETDLGALRKLGSAEEELITGGGLAHRSIYNRKVAEAALQFVEEWQSLTPEEQQARAMRVRELVDRSMKIVDIERRKSEQELDQWATAREAKDREEMAERQAAIREALDRRRLG